MLLNMPQTIPVKDLESTNSQYNSNKMQMYDALYSGGDAFNKLKEKFLPRRPIESVNKGGLNGNKLYELRKESAFYSPYVSGIMEWLSARIVENHPRITIEDPTGLTEESIKYWESLNEDADGRGTPLISLCREAAKETLVNCRNYMTVTFDDPTSKDGRINLLDAAVIDDWQTDTKDNILWVRRHTSQIERDAANPWMPATMVSHYWTYYDEAQIIVYKATRKIDDHVWDKNAVATKIDVIEHDFGMPVFDIKSSIHVMERIEQPIIKLFQREASLNYYLDNTTYQMPYMNLQNPNSFDQLPITPLGCLVLELDEHVGYFGPDPSGFNPSFQAVEQCKKSLYECLQVLSKEITSVPQAGRLSGTAVNQMQKPMEILIGSFAWPIKEALSRLVKSLKIYRNEEDAKIEIEGFGAESVDEEELKKIIMGEIENAREDNVRESVQSFTRRESPGQIAAQERSKERAKERATQRAMQSDYEGPGEQDY